MMTFFFTFKAFSIIDNFESSARYVTRNHIKLLTFFHDDKSFLVKQFDRFDIFTALSVAKYDCKYKIILVDLGPLDNRPVHDLSISIFAQIYNEKFSSGQ